LDITLFQLLEIGGMVPLPNTFILEQTM